jgi:hypothetical protein
LYHVFEYFDIQVLGHASRVCNLWHQLSKLDILWKTNSSKYFQSVGYKTNDVSEMNYEHFKMFLQQLPHLQLFAFQIPTTNMVYTFDPFTKFCARGTSLNESISEFWNVMSFLGIQHDENHHERLIEARPQHGENSSSIVREGLYTTSREECYDVYLIYYSDNAAKKIQNYPITCFCPVLEIMVEYEGHLPIGDIFTQQNIIEREMATKMQAALTCKIRKTAKFIMWDKTSVLCTKMYRVMNIQHEKNDDGKAKRAQYWFGKAVSEQKDESSIDHTSNPRYIFVQ